MSLYIDLSELLAVPMKTGIQRIGGEICRYSPPNAVIPVQLRSDHYVALPPALIKVIGEYFRDSGDSGVTEIRRLSSDGSASRIKISSNDIVLVPEIFGEERASFFRRMPEQQFRQCRFVVYDLLPLTHPEYFPPDMPVNMAGYFNVVRQANRCGFISEHTRDVYYRRLRRTEIGDGVVLPLGCDALGPRPKKSAFNRPLAFSVLGTIEPRKNHALILEAFEPLLRDIDGLSLSFIGKMGWVEPELAAKVRTLASEEGSGFHFLSAPADGTIQNYIQQSRATIYVSAAEGYGLPPVESLWAGTPVIASSVIPSLSGLGSAGIHYVEPLTVDNLRRAVLAFVEDDYANRKVEEAANLVLPTWRSFTDDVFRWCTAGGANQ